LKRTVSIIVPAYNEQGNVCGAVSDILTAARDARLDAFEVILVDDGSTDGTWALMKLLERTRWSTVSAYRHPENRGLKAAYENVVWFPSDLEMARESIRDILAAIGTADLVIPYHGNPSARPWFRRLLTWGSTLQLNVALGHRLRYFQGTLALPTEMARRLPRTESGFFFAAEMLSWALEEGPAYVEVPLVHQERTYGVSKAVSWKAIWRAQCLIARLAFRIHAERAALLAQYALLEKS
jgi:glycosyltransferase involved in cell wall biosynthesis